VPTLANRTIISVHVYGPNITVSALLCKRLQSSVGNVDNFDKSNEQRYEMAAIDTHSQP
jgi:hypothetical protein